MIMDRGQEIEFASNAAIDGLCSLEGFDKTDMCNMFTSGVTWADAHPKNPWISVKNRLPEERNRVFTAGGTCSYDILLYHAGKFYQSLSQGLYDGGVTHWMPIPELNVEPKE